MKAAALYLELENEKKAQLCSSKVPICTILSSYFTESGSSLTRKKKNLSPEEEERAVMTEKNNY